MATPVRFTTGVTQDAPWQPLALSGFPNPFFYHLYADDFDVYNTTAYTATLTGTGSAALSAVDGGNILLTTNNSTPLATDIASLQLKAAGFQFVPATSSVAGKKTFFLARVQVASAVNCTFNVGLMNTTATPGAPTDGIYFNKLTGSASNLQLTIMTGSVPTQIVIPTSAYTLANNTTIDLGFVYDGRTGDVQVFVNSNMIGYLPVSGTGATQPNRGPVAALRGATVTTAILNPTIALISGTAASTTMTADLVLAARER